MLQGMRTVITKIDVVFGMDDHIFFMFAAKLIRINDPFTTPQVITIQKPDVLTATVRNTSISRKSQITMIHMQDTTIVLEFSLNDDARLLISTVEDRNKLSRNPRRSRVFYGAFGATNRWIDKRTFTVPIQDTGNDRITGFCLAHKSV